MSYVHKRLGAVITSPAAGTLTSLYTVPTGKTAVVKELILASDNAAAADVQISINGVIMVRKPVAGGGATLILPLSTVLYAGESLGVVVLQSASTYYQASGWEFNTPLTRSVPIRFKANPAANTPTNLYTVPAGKRLVIKEYLFAQNGHNNSTAVSVYVSGVINLFRGTMPGADTLIRAVDTVLEAGQTLTYNCISASAEITVSGLLEDI